MTPTESPIVNGRVKGLAPLTQKGLVNMVVDAIVEAAATGVFLPGDRIVEAEVARALNVSRIPVREALRLLESQGVVVSERYRGMSLMSVDIDRLESEGRIAPALAGRRSRMLARCGMPLPGTELRIVDAGGRRLAEREVGRIMVRSPSVMEGYFREPEETARALDPSGWLDTGDLGAVVEGDRKSTRLNSSHT